MAYTWNSDNLMIPLAEFMQLFALTEEEVRLEGFSGRLLARGIPVGDNGWTKICITEQSAQAWVLDKLLPRHIRDKIKRAGGLDALDRWRHDYFNRVQFELDAGAMILPDGSRVEDVKIRMTPKH